MEDNGEKLEAYNTAVYHFVIPGKPVSWKSPRLCHGTLYSPKEMREYQQRVQAYFRERYSATWPTHGAVVLRIWVYAPEAAGDLTNIAKNVEDALEGLAYYNDRQVIGIHTTRQPIEDEHNQRVEVLVVCEK